RGRNVELNLAAWQASNVASGALRLDPWANRRRLDSSPMRARGVTRNRVERLLGTAQQSLVSSIGLEGVGASLRPVDWVASRVVQEKSRSVSVRFVRKCQCLVVDVGI